MHCENETEPVVVAIFRTFPKARIVSSTPTDAAENSPITKPVLAERAKPQGTGSRARKRKFIDCNQLSFDFVGASQ